ncbi:MAG TPA: ATPase [Allosphingosinicella sp.]|nr:ATPase [Allosphingosinicella sp.]
MKRIWLIGMSFFWAASAQAEVKSASPGHFEVEQKLVVAAAPDEAYAMLGRIGEWWSKDHSYSGDASNLSLHLEAGGCFCEKLKGGGTVEHLRIVYAEPGKRLRATGGLGPLQGEAVAATLTWSLKPAPGGTEITQNYLVSGHVRSGMEKLAPLVDHVLLEQLSGLQRRLTR